MWRSTCSDCPSHIEGGVRQDSSGPRARLAHGDQSRVTIPLSFDLQSPFDVASSFGTAASARSISRPRSPASRIARRLSTSGLGLLISIGKGYLKWPWLGYAPAFVTIATVLSVNRISRWLRKTNRDLRARAVRFGRDPDTIKVLPGIIPLIADTGKHARRCMMSSTNYLIPSGWLVAPRWLAHLIEFSGSRGYARVPTRRPGLVRVASLADTLPELMVADVEHSVNCA